jgi:hypothetical protein
VDDSVRNSLLSNRETLMRLSEDKTNHAFMTLSKLRALDFDKIKTEYTQHFHLPEEKIRSVDAVLCSNSLNLKNEDNCFVEFKNGEFSSSEIIGKAKDSLLIFCDLVKCTISDTREHSVFILVYNPEKKTIDSRDRIHFYTAKQAGSRYVPFGLRILMLYFSDIKAFTQQEFEDFLEQKYVLN